MKHYSLPELDRYRSGNLPLFARLLCRWHLVKCNRCRARLARLEIDELLLRDVKGSIKILDIPENRTSFSRLCETFHETPERHSTV